MRILRIDSWDGQRGGAQEYVRSVTEELAARGHETRILNITDGGADVNPRSEVVIPVEPRGTPRVAFDLLPAPRLDEAIDRAVREFRPDLVQLHHFDAGFTTIASRLRRSDRPLIMTAHDAELVCPISTLVRPGNVICEGGVRVRCMFTGCRVGFGVPYNLRQRWVFDSDVAPTVRAFLCPSTSLTRYLDSNGYRPAIHLPSFARIPAEVAGTAPPPPPDGSMRIGYLGRLDWYKGVHDLIRALSVVRRSVPSARLDIAGDGPFRAELERIVREEGLTDAVDFRGRLEGAAKEQWFGRIAIFSAPSNQWENFPLVALEALVRGRPVVATNIGGIPDIVEEGVSGHLVPISDPPALATALLDLLGDPDRARAWGLEGRRRVLSTYTPEIHVNRLLAVYRHVLDGGSFRSGMEAQELVGTGAG